MNQLNGQGERHGYWEWEKDGRICCGNYSNGLFHGECKDLNGTKILIISYYIYE
jgi:hypothetical protein